MDGVGARRGELEDGESEAFEKDSDEKIKTKMLLELLARPIVLQMLIPADYLAPNDVLCKQASLVD